MNSARTQEYADVDTNLGSLRRNARSVYVDTKRVIAVLALCLLTACSTAPKIEYRVADVSEPLKVNRPELPVLTVTKDMDPGTVIQLHRETIKLLQAWGLELEAALNAYRKKDPK